MSHNILSKTLSVEMFGRGEFGNRLRQWNSIQACVKSGYKGKVALRYKDKKGGGGPCKYNIPIEHAAHELIQLCLSNVQWNPNYFYVNEMGPDSKITLQGEFYDNAPSWGGYYLLYSTVGKAMREALAINRSHHYGNGSLLILKQVMSRDSYEDFELLRNLYPDHVIEFSCYSINLGSLPRRNTIFWEVRKY